MILIGFTLSCPFEALSPSCVYKIEPINAWVSFRLKSEKEYRQRIFHGDLLSPSLTLIDVWSERETFPPFLVLLTCPVCQSGEKQAKAALIPLNRI